jgi:cytochrome o ubiquinol oxidase subunit 1
MGLAMISGALIWLILLGRFTWGDLPFVKVWDDPTVSNIIAALAALIAVLGAVFGAGLITYLGRWRYLWTEWFTSLDHKKIGIMYICFAIVMMTRALIEAMLMRVQQDLAVSAPGILAPDHFAQFFTTHGTIMIFFVAMPLLSGLINFAMPLQIGSRDVAFPFMNSMSLWLSIGGGGLIMVSLVIGEFSTGGWSGYPPYTELAFNGGSGPDYWIWAVTMSSISAMLTGINFAVTIYKLRAPGMHWMRLPLFTWTSLCTAILMIFAMPPLTVATLLLAADRYLGMHFFTNDLGGNLMNYVNLFWLFGHPEVYILILPAFGVYSEVVSAYSSKKLYGYTSLVIATMAIAVLSFTVWLHHFFTMGQSADINAFFGIATMLIGIPTGVKIYNWIWTMFRGKVRYTAPMLFSIAFMITFVIGGLTGIMLATPPLDYMFHNTLFLVAHFHNMLVPGTLFGMIAGCQYWFPKAFGFRLAEKWGRIAVFFWVAGFYLAFMPLYVLGASGATRRTAEFYDPAFRLWLEIAMCGAFLIFVGFACLFLQVWSSIRQRDRLAAFVGDPWDGRGLEWSISSPPPEYNFATIPQVSRRDAFYWRKLNGGAYKPADHYRNIEMPKNSACGALFGIGMAIAFFGLVWHIWWMAGLFGLITVISGIARSFMRDLHKVIPAAEVEAHDRRWLAAAAAAQPVPRTEELTPANEGLAVCPE